MKDRLNDIMLDKQMNKSVFAEKVGISKSALSHVLQGNRPASDNMLSSILLAFPDINPNWLINGTGEMYLDNSKIEKEEIPDNQLALFDDYIEKDTHNQNNNPILSKEISLRDFNNQEKYLNEEEKSKSRKDNDNYKKIKKIVFFYTDRTFEEYYPE